MSFAIGMFIRDCDQHAVIATSISFEGKSVRCRSAESFMKRRNTGSLSR